ncbi:protein-L-isoaspartate(D-aspartate) O-methyltransferase [Bacteroidota bacterium]
MEDNFRHKGLRKNLAETVRRKGIKDKRIIDAINKVPRHLFMDSGFIDFAYRDQAFPIGAGQTISQPYTVAFQTELLDISKGDKVLEIGTGSGYQAAILIEMGANLYTIERQRELFQKTRNLLPKLGYNPVFLHDDGYKGLPAYAPFDKILVTAAAKEVPEELKEQLKIGGRIVIPLGGKRVQTMILIEKLGENKYKSSEHGDFVFVPLLKGKVN